MNEKIYINKTNNYLFVAIFFIVTAVFTIVAITIHFVYAGHKYSEYGTLGDAIGGITNPIIAIGAAILTFAAFYIQYLANKQVQDQFKVQQFESQFYEMLHLHRENLNEMKIEGYQFEYQDDDKSKKAIENSKSIKTTTDKKVFVTMLKEFEAINLICKKVFFSYYKSKPLALSELNKFIGKQLIFDHAYYVFFNGIAYYNENIKKYAEKDDTGLLTSELLDKYVKELSKIRDNHLKYGIKEYKKYTQTRENIMTTQTLWLSFNYKPFSGHQSILAHYYRHLFQTVKFVVKQDENNISYESKRDYLRILRSMLSNHEQILLYYNWLSGFGLKWETRREEYHLGKDYNNFNNRYFTDYRMIHNIPEQMIIDGFLPSQIFVNDYLNFKYEKGRKENDTLFELMGITSKL